MKRKTGGEKPAKTRREARRRGRLRERLGGQVQARSRWLTAVYIVLRLIVVAVGVLQFLKGEYHNVFMCLLTLVLFMIPSFVEHRIKIEVPEPLQLIILLFIFSAEVLGEISEYYIHVPHWDTMLHTINGFICAAVGVALIDILNRSDRFSLKMSPFFVAFFAFCFSMTVGVVWEFFEYGMDEIFRTDMQKDTIINSVSSVLFHPDGRNQAVVIDIESIVVNGETWNYGGYIDIGLKDTMKDLLVNFLGALIFSVIGFFYVKSRGEGKLVSGLMLKSRRGEGAGAGGMEGSGDLETSGETPSAAAGL